MKHNWQFKKLSTVCDRIGDGLHGTPTYVSGGGYYFVNGNNLKGGRISISKETKAVGQEEFEAHKVALSESTLLLSINGTVGEMALYRGEPIVLGKSAAYINCRDIDRRFCYYYFQLKGVKVAFYNIATGSTIKNLGLESLKNFLIPVPPRDIQEKIADLLSIIDAKIDLNNRITEDLEGMVKFLYDYWFMQFDFPITPAHAATMGKPQLEGKPYRASGGKMLHNETLKREIPEGWQHSTIGETFETHLGGTPSRKKEEYWTPGQVNWLSSGENPSTFVVGPDEKISNLGLQSSPAQLLPQGTVILSIVRHLRASILGIEAATNQSVVGIVETSAFKHCFIYPYLVCVFRADLGADSSRIWALIPG